MGGGCDGAGGCGTQKVVEILKKNVNLVMLLLNYYCLLLLIDQYNLIVV